MSEISDAIQAKCLAFGDRVIKLNDYLLEQAASKRYDGGSKRYDVRKGKSSFSHQTSDLSQPSSFSHHTSRVPVHLQSVAALANQLLRSGTSIGANNAEACNAVSRQDFRSKSYIALKEARESLYWIELLKRNNYIDERQYQSIYEDCEELVKILVARCKKLDAELASKEK
jgi:four helix bundle protein